MSLLMKIWHANAPTIDQINTYCQNTLISELSIMISALKNDEICATMPLSQKVMQPYGIMHGGASCVLAETLGSVAAHCCIDTENFLAVGQTIETSHIRPASKGILTASAKPVHIGKKTQIWLITISDDRKNIISHSKLTLAIIPKNQLQVVN
jgi:1,4-dihydroxy-2-naphthoyl-CoA hydrolase